MSTVLADPPNGQFRFSVEKFHDLAESGLIPMDTSLELIDGIIYEMHPLGPYHCSLSEQIDRLLTKSACDKVLIREEKPIVLNEFSEPIPDISVVNFDAENPHFMKTHPTSKDVRLLIEVADSSYLKDRNIKLKAYSEASIPEVWIVNASTKQIEWYSKPLADSGEYSENGVFESTELIDRGDFSLDLAKLSF